MKTLTLPKVITRRRCYRADTCAFGSCEGLVVSPEMFKQIFNRPARGHRFDRRLVFTTTLDSVTIISPKGKAPKTVPSWDLNLERNR